MTPAARMQAAIDLLDAIIDAARHHGAAADTLIARYFAQRRYAGSKDRRAVRELVYAAIRALGEVPRSGRAAMLAITPDAQDRATLFDGTPHGPAPVTPGEPVAEHGIAPAWLVDRLAASGIDAVEMAALIDRAPLDLRVNRLTVPDGPGGLALEEGTPIAGLPDAVRLPAGFDISALAGRAEVQDAGSQTVTMAARAVPGMRIVDLCAGAGGKSLALAATMGGEGAILACDIDRGRLSRLLPRAALAGATTITTRLLNPGQELALLDDWRARADCVVIDAPCSGTGTWRRNPEGRWRLTPAELDRLADTQRRLIDLGAALVRPGGALVYIVCSLLDGEGAGLVTGWLDGQPSWRADRLTLPFGTRHGPGMRLTPARDSTDGFFVARLESSC